MASNLSKSIITLVLKNDLWTWQGIVYVDNKMGSRVLIWYNLQSFLRKEWWNKYLFHIPVLCFPTIQGNIQLLQL